MKEILWNLFGAVLFLGPAAVLLALILAWDWRRGCKGDIEEGPKL